MTDPARYIVGSDQLTDGIGLRGFSDDGSPLWASEQRARTLARHRDGWFVSGSASRVRRFDATGAEVWAADAGGTVRCLAVNLAGRVAAGNNHGVRVYDADGALRWSRETSDSVRGVAIDADGGVATAQTGGRVERLAPDGALIWAAERGVTTLAVALTSGGDVIAAGVPDADGDHLTAYDPDGAPIWSAAAGSAPHLWTVAIDDRGHITIGGAAAGGIVARQFTGGGNPVWSSAAADPGQIRALSVTPDGTILTAGAWGSGAKVALLDAADGTVIWTDTSFDRAASTAAAPGVRDGGHWQKLAERAAHGTAAAILGAIGGKRTGGGGGVGTPATFTSLIARRSGGAAALTVGAIGAAAAARTARSIGTVRVAVDLPAAVSRLTRPTATIKAGVTLGGAGLAVTAAPVEPPMATAGLTIGTGTRANGRTRRPGIRRIAVGGTGAGATAATHDGRARLSIGSHGWAALATVKPSPTLLPSSATNEMRALETVTARATDLPALHRDNADPERVRSQLLPWQAWERAVDIWEHQWDDATKRAVSGRALATHRIRGTPAAVESALTSLGVDDAELTEWFEDTPEGPPYTFRATVTRADGIEKGLTRNLGRAVAASKNTRSHMTRLTLVVPMAVTPLYAAPAALAGQAVTVAPLWDPPGAIASTAAQAGAVHSVTAVTVPAHNEDTDA